VCFSADEVTQQRSVDNLWTYTCDFIRKHESKQKVVWDDGNDADPFAAATNQTLDPYFGPLLACVKVGEPFVEYGIIEWRLRQRVPALFADMIREHGHRQLNPIPTSKTSSAYLAQALGVLGAQGHLERVAGKATGAWKYNGEVMYWALPPGPPTTNRLTWAAFADHNGLDPDNLGESSAQKG
jgi:hypothetical protein